MCFGKSRDNEHNIGNTLGMDLTVSNPRSDVEARTQRAIVKVAFGEDHTQEDPVDLERHLQLVEPAHTLVVRGSSETGEDEVIGGLVGAEFQLTMPGGALVPAAGLAGVGVHPARTGRGALRALMGEHLARCQQRGQAASVLWASEAGLYSRYGYGRSTSLATYELLIPGASELLRSEVLAAAPDAGRCDLVLDPQEARRLLTQIYADLGDRVAGTTSRSAAWWDIVLSGQDDWMAVGKRIALVHWNANGEPDGYALYKMVEPHGGDDWLADGTVSVREFVGANPGVERSMLEFLKSVPLCRRIRFDMLTLRPRLAHQLRDPRQLRQVAAHDGLWLRPVDVAKLLQARSYLSDGQVAFAVTDSLLPDQCGPWSLEVRDGVAMVTRLRDGAPSEMLSISPSQLGSVLLGDTRVAELVDAGVIVGDPESIRTFDRLMLSEQAPFSFSKF